MCSQPFPSPTQTDSQNDAAAQANIADRPAASPHTSTSSTSHPTPLSLCACTRSSTWPRRLSSSWTISGGLRRWAPPARQTTPRRAKHASSCRWEPAKPHARHALASFELREGACPAPYPPTLALTRLRVGVCPAPHPPTPPPVKLQASSLLPVHPLLFGVNRVALFQSTMSNHIR
eukprot:364203-Chlamydomonas_euryale.AAC.1